MAFITVLLGICLYAKLLVAQASGGYFIQPPASPAGGQSAGDYAQDSIYVVGTPLSIEWQTNIPNRAVSVGLWQQDVSTDLQPTTTITSNTTLSSFPWDGVPFQDLSLGRVFFLQIYDADNTTLLATSHYFNMTGDKPGSSSSSSSSSFSSSSTVATATASSTSTNINLTTTAPRTTAATASSPTAATSAAAPGSNSDHSLALGVGVGVGVGILLAAVGTAVGVFFCLRNRRQHKSQSAAVSTSTNQLPYEHTKHELDSKGTTGTSLQPSWQNLPRQELQ